MKNTAFLFLFLMNSYAMADVNQDLLNYTKKGLANELLKLLSTNDQNLNINTQDEDGNTAIHQAIQTDNAEILNILLKQNSYYSAQININLTNNDGITPLFASIDECLDCVAPLVNSGLNIDLEKGIIDQNINITPLLLSIQNKEDTISALLIKSGAKIDGKFNSEKGESSVFEFLVAGESNFINLSLKELIKRNQDINLRLNKSQETALMLLSSKGNLEGVKILVENGAMLNQKSNVGATALHYAVQSYRKIQTTDEGSFRLGTELISYLIENGADVEATNNKMQTARDLYNISHKFFTNLEKLRGLLNETAKKTTQKYEFEFPEAGLNSDQCNVSQDQWATLSTRIVFCTIPNVSRYTHFIIDFSTHFSVSKIKYDILNLTLTVDMDGNEASLKFNSLEDLNAAKTYIHELKADLSNLEKISIYGRDSEDQ